MSVPTLDHPHPAPAHHDPQAALLRIARAVDGETEPLYRRKDAGHDDVLPTLRAIGFLALELGFTVAEEGGLDCTAIEAAVADAFDLPDYGDRDPRRSQA
ncbi:hypothetical protein [Saccharomonospora iraqiensis]|uniref:hypothetical protein n=1 Tax=Saccharomonospora iraqiensis TaxID=52698 RepID=UPI00022DF483|nr:hypothetical protein [Saccharomonospora iraqiensis]